MPAEAIREPRASRDADSHDATVEAEVVDSSVVDESVLWRVLRQAGRVLARPALECLEVFLDGSTPPQVRLTMLAALTYLVMPLDLIPDFIPVGGFSDDLVALTALMSVWRSHLTPEIQRRARRRLDHWFPPAR
jgi:uncharacterized membrane protein YkvA (DUF1232 family)